MHKINNWVLELDLKMIQSSDFSIHSNNGILFITSILVLKSSFLYEGTSLIAQLVKIPPAMQETPVLFLSW